MQTISVLTPQQQALLPDSLQDMVGIIGITATLRVVALWGGLQMYFSANFEKHLKNHFSAVDIELMMLAYAGETIYIPRAFKLLLDIRNTQIRAKYAAKGKAHHTAQHLAKQYQLSQRIIFKIVKAPVDEAVDDGQMAMEI